MTRTPLRPLARILSARAKGGNPDVIEAENLDDALKWASQIPAAESGCVEVRPIMLLPGDG